MYARQLMFQSVEASSAEEAYDIAEDDPRFEPCESCFTLESSVKDVETGELIHVGETTSRCKSCGSEIVETINDSNFRDGECGPCEYERYKSQPHFRDALDFLLEQTVDVDLAHGIALTRGERQARSKALKVFATYSSGERR